MLQIDSSHRFMIYSKYNNNFDGVEVVEKHILDFIPA